MIIHSTLCSRPSSGGSNSECFTASESSLLHTKIMLLFEPEHHSLDQHHHQHHDLPHSLNAQPAQQCGQVHVLAGLDGCQSYLSLPWAKQGQRQQVLLEI